MAETLQNVFWEFIPYKARKMFKEEWLICFPKYFMFLMDCLNNGIRGCPKAREASNQNVSELH